MANHGTLDGNALFDLLTRLRSAGYRIGTRQFQLAHDLLAAFVADTGAVDPKSFAAALRPVLAKSPREQEEFQPIFDAWLLTSLREGPSPAAPAVDENRRATELRRDLSAFSRSMKVWMGLALAICILAGFWYWSVRRPSNQPPPPGIGGGGSPTPPPVPAPGENPPDQSASNLVSMASRNRAVLIEATLGAFAALALMLGSYVVIRRISGQRFLKRQSVTRPPDLTDIRVETDVGSLIPRGPVRVLGKALRRRYQVEGSVVAPTETVRRTASAGGIFTPVYVARQIMPEYLVLVRRSGQMDENARLARQLCHTLDDRDRLITIFYFDDDFVTVFPDTPGMPPLRLDQLSARHRDDRLIVFADPGIVTGGSIEQAETLLARFDEWRTRVWVTPVPLEGRIAQDRKLVGRFHVYPFSDGGLTSLARYLGTLRPEPVPDGGHLPLEPPELRARPDRWLSRSPAPDDETDGLVLSLRTYLGSDGFEWLCACATYPEMHPRLTAFIGRSLPRPDTEPIFEPGLYLRLNGLPWLREGWMPQWLRERLVDEMSPGRTEEVRTLLQSLLLTSLRGETSGLELKVAQRHPALVAQLLKGILPPLVRMAGPDNPLSDVVFVSVLSGRTAVPLPTRLVNLLRTGTAHGRAARRKESSPGVRRLCRICVAALAIGLAVMIGSGFAFALSASDLSLPMMVSSLEVLVFGTILLFAARRIASVLLTVIATLGILGPMIAGAASYAVTLSPVIAWGLPILFTPLLLLAPAGWRASAIVSTPKAPSAGRRTGSYAAVIASFLFFAGIVGVPLLGFLAVATGSKGWAIVPFVVALALEMAAPLVCGPALAIKAAANGSSPAFRASVLLLGWYYSLVLMAALLAAAWPLSIMLALVYGSFGATWSFQAYRQLRRDFLSGPRL